MSKFDDQLVKIVEDYRAAKQPWPASAEQLAEWAVAQERFQITRGMAVSQCKERITRAMRLRHIRDKKGRSIRQYYAARVREDGQLVMKWDDLNAARPFMQISVANRRNHILGECHQLKNDLDSYNERKCPENPIQTSFDFTIDLEELNQLDDVAQSDCLHRVSVVTRQRAAQQKPRAPAPGALHARPIGAGF
ncbi:MAG TPA: hypothetical protein VFB31_07725 [Pseudolabrys sp.]|nr:hypothetical protein [Pseudolabrys sp.]